MAQVQLAAKAGISQNYLSALENGVPTPPLSTRPLLVAVTSGQVRLTISSS